MIEKELLEPVLQGGIRNIHFFNGRLLTAEDMGGEQQANRQQHRQLGQAIGDGIVYGLEVRVGTQKGARPTVVVTSGLAINRRGLALSVPDEVKEIQVALVRKKPAVTEGAGLFAECTPPTSTAIPTGTGVYILVLSPASGFAERAPKVGLDDYGVARGCGRRYAVEGVRFRLLRLDLTNASNIRASTRTEVAQLMAKSDAASLSKLRNLLAHLCFGTEDVKDFAHAPFQHSTGEFPDSALTHLRAAKLLTACDVPLALIYWTRRGIEFVDMGSVRRRPTPAPVSSRWPLALGGSLPQLGEAIGLQFQEQLAQLASLSVPQSTLSTIQARSYFRYLPAAGLIPITGIESAPTESRNPLLAAQPSLTSIANLAIANLERLTVPGVLSPITELIPSLRPLPGVRTSRGFLFKTFFRDLTYREPVFIEGGTVGPLLRESLSYAPIDLSTEELIWLYVVRENIEAIDNDPSAPPQAYMVFASGHIPYRGAARYDVSRWDYGNFA